MIGMIVGLTIAPGSGDAFERAFAVQAAAVRANEPGNRQYELFRSQTLPNNYTLVEIYDDEAALAAHRASPQMATSRPLTAPFLVEPPAMQVFDVVSADAGVSASQQFRPADPQGRNTGDRNMPTPMETVSAFCAAFSENHAEDAIRRWFTPTTIWINEGLSMTTGVEEAIKRPRSPDVAAVYFDMLSIAADGNRVLTERLDRFVRSDGSEVAALKVMGIFEIEGDFIVAWRDYFDVNLAKKMPKDQQ
ncbi:antibiotic biosynthesis monooxygenase [Agrobacterium sp. MCAB5]|uniref:antibiotic biosynthesis monooxygenase n=1 Tax=Agrobacterium sp. MCAB5 TaxID=3233042 RepID=UPI003F90BFA4